MEEGIKNQEIKTTQDLSKDDTLRILKIANILKDNTMRGFQQFSIIISTGIFIVALISGFLAIYSFTGVRTNYRLSKVETRMDNLETRMDNLETRMDNLETRMDRLETRMDRLEAGQVKIETELKEIKNLIKSALKQTRKD